jgi:hypothetical protein
MTTELKTMVPKIDLAPNLAKWAPTLENTWISSALVRPWALGPTLELSLGFQAVRIETSTVKPSWEGFLVSQRVWEVPAKAQVPLFEADLAQKVAKVNVSNAINVLPTMPLNVMTSEPPLERPVVGILWQALTERMTSFLEEVRTRLDQLVSPMPAFAPVAVLTGGPVRKRGGLEKKALGQVTAFVLNKGWEPERALSLPVIDGPMVKNGRLTLVLRVEDPSLVGREADLALVVEGLEVALCSARVPALREGGADLTFELDLAEAGIKVRDGLVPLKVFQVFIESKTPEEKRRRIKRKGAKMGDELHQAIQKVAPRAQEALELVLRKATAHGCFSVFWVALCMGPLVAT